MNEICEQDHRYDGAFARLPDSQANAEGRHRCAGCAYDQGHADGLAGIEPNFRPDELDWSQAGEVRHKSASAGYSVGFTDGMRARP